MSRNGGVVDLTADEDDDEIEVLSESPVPGWDSASARQERQRDRLAQHILEIDQGLNPAFQQVSSRPQGNRTTQGEERRRYEEHRQLLERHQRQRRQEAHRRQMERQQQRLMEQQQRRRQHHPRFHAMLGGLGGYPVPIAQGILRFITDDPAAAFGTFGDEESQLRQALYLSARQTQPQTSVSVDEIEKKPEEPEKTREGFTRAIKPSLCLVCAKCGGELGEEEDQKGLTEADAMLSKRVYFSTCGHVYCGKCVNHIVNHKKARGEKKQCLVPNCNTSFKGKHKFREIYY
ncbi:hypothetical protein TRICI_003281 [Trichomonascus ciferrii]|uniref:RING-type domain-containing protein n=1 Tax=Trichomonascus ciferrii TaxID=44093 RepID=A0A642V4H2_9ASCO|nr:hypothetical protein TRICI_003281 [Trichomonascus ciferrii]